MFTKWCRAFPGLPDQVVEARHFVAALLQESSVVDDAVLVVSELATNAVRHTLSGSPGGWFLVVVVFRADCVRLEVVDMGGDHAPRMRDEASQDDGGRGLVLVAACAKDWGVKGVPSGRTVWADLVRDGV
ncbi:ATP-binding protein [Streptomyces europaeiscabiei]|uniref:ATP-binding protein n=1 Tax=Streptomyces europaeiscabiei TaxID=146819 RepID=A0ABU4NUC6_9ACTN|nr:ATP-binding protein [Streptomyces europaeiscabiei]MDX3548820.1 ATP-binding protein [Streptomyces europaeiscabiei]MDX3555126.1 ATP-binding protein [Streptomyces europaeiscabiei]MDX3705140.1 ATP-binding protein [Streptomyces europaeiscabiei]